MWTRCVPVSIALIACGLAAAGLGDLLRVVVEHRAQGLDRDLVGHVALDLEAGARGKVDDLRGVQRLGHLRGE
jgi:hypothetical protein